MKKIFDRIVYLLCGAALSLVGLALADFLLHPLGTDYIFHSTLYRAVVMLVLTPLTLLVGFLIIRRVPGNIVGPLLIVWSGTVVNGSIRKEIGPVPNAFFYYYDIAFGWFGLFLMILHFPNGEIYPPGAARWIYRQLGFNFVVSNLIFLSTPYLQVSPPMANPFFLPALQAYEGPILVLGISFSLPILLLNLISPVLRYRLWDIDIIIRRTLVYSILTVILSLVYFGSVVSLQELFQLITRQQQSPVATVISTLVIAALFTPLRRRIQERIDRHFYRRKYDGEQVLAAFSTTLREEVDLDRLAELSLGVVEDTMQPEHVSLWLRDVDLQPGER